MRMGRVEPIPVGGGADGACMTQRGQHRRARAVRRYGFGGAGSVKRSWGMEAEVGIEPAYTALQAAA